MILLAKIARLCEEDEDVCSTRARIHVRCIAEFQRMLSCTDEQSKDKGMTSNISVGSSYVEVATQTSHTQV